MESSTNKMPTFGDLTNLSVEKIRKAFAPQDLLIDLKLAQGYQVAPSDSRENQLQLLRIVAASVNALARRTYLDFHPDINIKPPRQANQFKGTDEFYVNFYHTSYMHFERYPFGLLDVLGYWAETEIFGGLLLFEREELGSNIINAFLLPQEASHAFQLSETQLECFSGLKVGDSEETVLPFAREADARTELPVVRVGEPPLRIYKNEYDKPSASNWPARSSCVINEGDPRAASFDRAMATVVEKGWDKQSTFTGSLPSFESALLTAGEASSSSKDDPPLASKHDEGS